LTRAWWWYGVPSQVCASATTWAGLAASIT
jgi:hypothetical protein